MRLVAVLLASSVVVAACNPFDRSGTLTAQWAAVGDTLGETARVTIPVSATWCVGPSRLDIRAAAGDTGFALTLYPSDSSALAGRYSVLEPGASATVRPSAGVALRYMGKVVVQGWWGDSGVTTISGGWVRGLSGEGEAWLVSGLGPDSVTALDFTFRGVRVRNDTLCDAPPPPAVPEDSAGTLPGPGVD